MESEISTSNLRASAHASHAIFAAGTVIGAALGIPAGAIISSAPAIAAPVGCYEDDTSRCIDQTWVCWRDGNRRWRALALVIKAKLEAIESGISSFDVEFLGQLVLPDGRTVADDVVPKIVDAYENHRMPALLPTYSSKAIEA